MCTVTFLPNGNDGFFLTSNRDEAPQRQTDPPKLYMHKDLILLYPKDALAGGTWIGLNNQQRAVSIMNGGFIPHKRKASYGRSRGLIVLDLLKTPEVLDYLSTYDFTDIEPFTAIVVELEPRRLLEVVWDGQQLHRQAKEFQPHIWSSSPLYSPEVKQRRELWFKRFLGDSKTARAEAVLEFHQSAGKADAANGLIMNRGFVQTKSITQIAITQSSATMLYSDLQKSKLYEARIP